jgi:hypothetical protein
MRPFAFLSLFLVGFLTVLASRAVPTHACPEGCDAPSVDQTMLPPPVYVLAATAPTIVGVNQPTPAVAYPFTTLWKYTQVDGQYCTDKTGGQVYVPTGAPVPDGVRCGAAPASPSPSSSASPSSSPSASPSSRPSPSPSGSPASAASPSPSPSPTRP